MLVDKHDYHTFQPLLYQLATAPVETAVVGHALRDLFHEQPNVAVKQATVTGIDLAGRRVQFAEMAPLEYDYLVVAAGAEVTFFGTDGAAEHAFPMYTLSDAVRLKEHILRMWGRRTEIRRWWTMERSTSSSSAAARRGSRARARWPSSTGRASPGTTRVCRRRRPESSSSRWRPSSYDV